MAVIGDLRKKKFQGKDYVYGKIVPGYCYRLVLHSSLPNCPTKWVVILRKKDIKKLRKMDPWERHRILKIWNSHVLPLHKRKVVKV